MLPPGHIAAGYLVAETLLKFAGPTLSASESHQLIWWGMFFGFAPDLDMFFAFFLEKAFIVRDLKAHNHRKYLSHAPILWALAGAAVYFSASSQFYKAFGLMVWAGSWSHFLLDTIEYGIMWLWPFKKSIFAFKDKELVLPVTETKFFAYWWRSVKLYTRFYSFYLEILIIGLALIVYFK